MIKEKIDYNKRMLNNYDYPKRPCDTKCFDGCPARPSCPLFRTWESYIKAEKKIKNENIT